MLPHLEPRLKSEDPTTSTDATTSGIDFDVNFFFDWGNAPGTGPYFSANNIDAATQITSAALMGSICIVVFSFLRFRWPELYSHRLRLRHMRPPQMPRTLFGWIYPMVTMSDRHVLETIGLDALLFFRAYRMFIYMFVCLSVLGMAILYPVNFFWGHEEGHEDKDDGAEHTVFDSPIAHVSTLSGEYSIPHAFLAYMFAGVLYYYIDRFALHTITMRWHYLLLTRRSGNSRTLMVTHLPRELRNAGKLRAFVAGMQVGEVESVYVTRLDRELDDALADRAKVLGKLEGAYTAILGNPCKAPTYDPVLLRRVVLTDGSGARTLERQLLHMWARHHTGDSKTRLRGLVSRPTVLVNWHRADAIDHWREQLAKADKRLADARRSQEGSAGGTAAFVTMQQPGAAMVACQASLYAKPSTCKFSMAPEARAVVWRSIGRPYSKKMIRHVVGLLMTFALLLLWCVPVVLISTLISLRFLVTQVASLQDVVKNSKFVRSLLGYTLPSLILTIFMTVLPRLLWVFVLVGGDRAYSIADKNMFIRHFYFLVIFVVVIFGLSGSVWSSVYDLFTDFGSFWRHLVEALPQMATWYCVYVMLYGAGYQVMKLLHLKSVCRYLFHQAMAKTPREYMKAISPVFIDWGTFQPYTLLFFFIGILYAHLQPLLLPMCTLYFAVGLFVMKYMCVYAWYFRQQNAGSLWPIIIRRMTVCVLGYQVLVTAIFASNENHWFVAPMAILVLFSWYYFWVRCKTLKRMAEYVPLQLLREAERRRLQILEQEAQGTVVEEKRDPAKAMELSEDRWKAFKNVLRHPIEALVMSISFVMAKLQGDPAQPLWQHMDDYAFPERVSLRSSTPAGRSHQDPSRPKQQPKSILDIFRFTLLRMPRGLRNLCNEFFLGFNVPPARLDSSVVEYPMADSKEAETAFKSTRRRHQQKQEREYEYKDIQLSPQEYTLAPREDELEAPLLQGSGTFVGLTDSRTGKPSAMQYQTHSSELPYGTKMNRQYTDFQQPNQSYVKGILDTTQFSYLHPGLYGDLPSLWLPVQEPKDRAEVKRTARQRLRDMKESVGEMLEDNLVRMEDLHVQERCTGLGIDPEVLGEWDPHHMHGCGFMESTSEVARQLAKDPVKAVEEGHGTSF